MNKTYIMLKDIPVLEIEDYRCKILNYELLPISLRYPDVNYEMCIRDRIHIANAIQRTNNR